jgi:hypothetical protein
MGFGVVVIAVVWALCGITWIFIDVNITDAPAWISAGAAVLGALVSILALIAAGLAARAAYKVYKIESERDRVSEEERRERHEDSLKIHAAKVGSWLKYRNKPVRVGKKDVRPFYVMAVNAYDLPIYDVSIFYCIFKDDAYGIVNVYEMPSIAPHETVEKEASAFLLRQVHAEVGYPGRVAISFRDSLGIFWFRGVDGALERGVPRKPPLSISSVSKTKVYSIYMGESEELENPNREILARYS